MTGHIHSYESFGAVDGPGVRFIVFLHGCPFRCAYCHNPDTWAAPAALEATPEEVFARASRYRDYWRETGGITVSGGEPMLQADWVAELFSICRREGVTTCIDTCAGNFSRENKSILKMLSLTDTVLLDLKEMDPAAHRELTLADNAPVLDCARYLNEQHIDTWIRHVNVPGLTDRPEQIAALESFIAPFTNIKRVDYLPYHTMGVEKWKKLGLEYRLDKLLKK